MMLHTEDFRELWSFGGEGNLKAGGMNLKELEPEICLEVGFMFMEVLFEIFLAMSEESIGKAILFWTFGEFFVTKGASEGVGCICDDLRALRFILSFRGLA